MALAKSQRSLKAWGETEMENEIRQEIFRNRGEISARESYKSSVICGVCGNDKSKTPRNKKGQTVCEATERDCKKNS